MWMLIGLGPGELAEALVERAPADAWRGGGRRRQDSSCPFGPTGGAT
jgi:hypothetical protein